MEQLGYEELRDLPAENLQYYCETIRKWCNKEHIELNISSQFNDMVKQMTAGFNMKQNKSNLIIDESWMIKFLHGDIKTRKGKEKYPLKQRLFEIMKVRKMKDDKRVLPFNFLFLAYATNSSIRQVEYHIKDFKDKAIIERKAGNGGRRLKKTTKMAFGGNNFKWATFFLLDHDQALYGSLKKQFGWKWEQIVATKLTDRFLKKSDFIAKSNDDGFSLGEIKVIDFSDVKDEDMPKLPDWFFEKDNKK